MEIVQAPPPPPKAPRLPEQPQNQPLPGHDGHQPAAQNGSSHGEADWGEVRKPKKTGIVLIAIVGAIALVALFATGFLPRHQQQNELAADANAALNGPVPVNVVAPVRAPRPSTSTFPEPCAHGRRFRSSPAPPATSGSGTPTSATR